MFVYIWWSVGVTYIPYRAPMRKKLVSKKWRNIDRSFLWLLWNADGRAPRIFERKWGGGGVLFRVLMGNYGML